MTEDKENPLPATPLFQPPVTSELEVSRDWADPEPDEPDDAEDTVKVSPHFFRRDPDGSVRIRVRFTPEEAALIEEGAGETPLMLYIHRVLGERARYHARKRKEVEEARRRQSPRTD